MDRNFSITWLILGLVTQVIVLLIIWRHHVQIKTSKAIYQLIVLFNTVFIITASIVFHYRNDEGNDGKFPEGFNVPYTVFSFFYMLVKILFELINWTFAYRYWIVSLTLKQALSQNQERFDEEKQYLIFKVIAFVTISLTIGDAIIYWLA